VVMRSLREIDVTRNFSRFAALTALVGGMYLNTPADAQVERSGYSLPLNLAMEAAAEAIRTCEVNGYNVTVTIMDSSGVVKLLAKGPQHDPHQRFELPQGLHRRHPGSDLQVRRHQPLRRARRQEPFRSSAHFTA
jgi:hypothetical protein